MAVELAPPKGHGLVRVAHNLRRHVGPHQWASEPATDYWLIAGHADIITSPAAATVISALEGFGWTTTSLSVTAGSAADFLSSSDKGTHAIIDIGAASDLLQSPIIFGDYANGLVAAQILGHYPTTLTMDVYATFRVVNTSSDTTGFGFVEDGGSAIVANDHIAYIVSDGTNFLLRNDTVTDLGATADTNPHLFRIKVTSSNIQWYIDDVSQGTIALKADEWPASFGAGALAATGANFFGINWVHIWYE